MFGFFKNKKDYKNQLQNLYKKLGYVVIPFLPCEDECKRILHEYQTSPFSLVPKEYMIPVSKNILRGHIIMLWWLNNPRTNKNNPPQYFLFEYGINFNDELKKLEKENFISGLTVTDKGFKLCSQNKDLIRQHKAKKQIQPDGKIHYIYDDKETVQDKTKLVPFKSTGDFIEDQNIGRAYERHEDFQNAIKAYESAWKLSLNKESSPPPNIFNRLAIIQRKQKKYNEEIKIIETALSYYPTSDKFKSRLAKSKELLKKSETKIKKV